MLVFFFVFCIVLVSLLEVFCKIIKNLLGYVGWKVNKVILFVFKKILVILYFLFIFLSLRIFKDCLVIMFYWVDNVDDICVYWDCVVFSGCLCCVISCNEYKIVVFCFGIISCYYGMFYIFCFIGINFY